jgi:hypothetical protein
LIDSSRQIEMSDIPSVTRMLLKAATTRKKVQLEPHLQPLSVVANGVVADPVRLEKFRSACGYDASGTLPLTYPHIMAFALQLQVMLEPEFPFTPMGAVHVRNRIRQQRAIAATEALDFEVKFDGFEQVGKGYEIGLKTEVRVEGELIWDSLSVMLIRKGGSGISKDKADKAEATEYTSTVQWQLAANKGRQYAAASGDYNPIHLYAPTAKLMGFKRQIMHGMWSKSRSVAHLLPTNYREPVTVDVAFKLPIFLPATVTLMYNQDDTGSRFEMKDGLGEKPHLVGDIKLSAAIGRGTQGE